MADERKEKYINPYTDFGFKKLFGTEMNKDLLISFLNALFHDEQVIKDVKYLNSEKLGEDYEESVKIYRDLKNSLDTAVWKTNKEIARRMKTKGYAVEDIAEITGLTVKEIEGL
ncbi:MAG: PD-(D/E)XK nuclease family transposase [Prevotella sp.]|nr:PD-(D/E)XK nuclease family transposase [Prevotella sp.]